MEECINKTILLCSTQFPKAFLNVPRIYDPLTFSDSDQVARVACEAERLDRLRSLVDTRYTPVIYAVGCFFGIISTVLALIAYSLKDFKANAFIYYRAANVLDLIYMIYLLKSVLNWPLSFWSSKQKIAFELCVNYPTKVAAKAEHLLVLIITLDRAVACQLTTVYFKFEQKKVAYFCVVLCLIVAAAYCAPFTYNSLSVNFYNGTDLGDRIVPLQHAIRAFEGVSMLLLAPLVIKGLISGSRRKKRLLESGQAQTNTGQELLKQIKTNKYLCTLQLCEGIPFILTSIFAYVSFITSVANYKFYPWGFYPNSNTWIPNSTYDANLSHQKAFEVQQYVAVVNVFIDTWNHCCHFYSYFAFSPKFRKVVWRNFKNRVGDVIPQVNDHVAN